jgi:hypothetical protein
MNCGDIKASIALPHSPPWLLPTKLGYLVGVFIVMARKPSIDLPVPHKVELGMSQGKVLNREPLRMMDATTVS